MRPLSQVALPKAFRKGKAFDEPGKPAWTAKASPLWGRWQRVSADGEGEDANVFAIYRL